MAGKYRKGYRSTLKINLDAKVVVMLELLSKELKKPISHLIEDILLENRDIKEKLKELGFYTN